MSEPTQFQLEFPSAGEGDGRHLMTDDRVTRSLKNKAEEVYRLIVHSKLDFDRVSADYNEMVSATKGNSKDIWVIYKGDRWRYEAVKAMRDFVKDYPAMQCSRIELLRALLKSLSERGVVVNVDENLLETAGC